MPLEQEITYIEPDLLWDADKVQYYRNMQNFYNNNFWGYGMFGNQTNYDPHTQQEAILSNFDYAKSNVENFAENLAAMGIGEGVGLAIKLATTVKEIGSGAEAVVTTRPLSRYVTKESVIPFSEMRWRNKVPGAVKSTVKGSKNGTHIYSQEKVRILSPEQWKKAIPSLEKLMAKSGWSKITHPNLQGPGFTNGKWVVSDLGPGNVGRDWLGRVRLPDFTLETPALFALAMLRKGGRLNPIINNN